MTKTANKIRMTLVSRQPEPNCVLTTGALDDMMEQLQARGTIQMRDIMGNSHDCIVSDVEVTELGIEATIILPPQFVILSEAKRTVSMGCKVEPYHCPLCDDER